MGKVSDRLKEFVEDVANKDHIHILFSGRPTLTISKFVNSLKSVSSRLIRKEFPHIVNKELWSGKFWSQSYFVASVVQVRLEDVKRYVQSQGK